MPVEDLSAQPALIHREGRFFRAPGLDEVRPINGALSLSDDGFLYFDGDPFPPGGKGTYKVGASAGDGTVKLYPGLILDAHPEGRRFRIGYRYLGTYRQ